MLMFIEVAKIIALLKAVNGSECKHESFPFPLLGNKKKWHHKPRSNLVHVSESSHKYMVPVEF